MGSSLMFKSLIHFKLIFVSDVRQKCHFPACGYPVFPAPFIDETVLSLLSVVGSLIKYQLIVQAAGYIWALCSIDLCVCVMLVTYYFNY